MNILLSFFVVLNREKLEGENIYAGNKFAFVYIFLCKVLVYEIHVDILSCTVT